MLLGAEVACTALSLLARVRSRLAYAALLLAFALAAALAAGPDGAWVRALWPGGRCRGAADPARCRALLAPLAILLAPLLFHAALALLMVGVPAGATGAANWRVHVQRRLWLPKGVALGALLWAAARLPPAALRVYVPLAAALSILFLAVQVAVVVASGYTWAAMARGRAPRALVGGVGLGVALAALALHAAAVVRVHAAAAPPLPAAVVGVLALGALALPAAAVHPEVQHARPASGLVQAGAVTLYSAWQAWQGAVLAVGGGLGGPAHGGAQAAGALVTLGLQVYTGMRSGSHAGHDAGGAPLPAGALGYSPAFFHAMMLLTAAYLAMLITDWGEGGESGALSDGAAAVTVRLGSAAAAQALYAWTLAAPLLYPDRSFD